MSILTIAQTLTPTAPATSVGTPGNAINGNWMAQGTPSPFGNVNRAVAIYFLSGGTWALQQTLIDPQPAAGSSFGTSICFSDDGSTLFIGFSGSAAHPQGKVYVYTLVAGVWTLQQTLAGTDGVVSDAFGIFVAFSPGNGLLVGAPGIAVSGSVYYFTLVAGVWTQQQKFTSSDNTAGFGANVTAGGQFMAAEGEGAGGTTFAYVFELSAGSWVQQQKLSPQPANGTYQNYGCFLTPVGNTLVIGGKTTSGTFIEFADVYLLNAGTFVFDATITHGLDGFGDPEQFAAQRAIGGDDNFIIIGAEAAVYSGGNPGPGQVYIYQAPAWTLAQTIDPDATTYGIQNFGIAVSGSIALGTVPVGTQSSFGTISPPPLYVLETEQLTVGCSAGTAAAGVPYSSQVPASGGTPPYTFLTASTDPCAG